MVFPLSDRLAQDILCALENQEQVFLVDAKTASLVPATKSADEDSFYSLPEWNSSHGFSLRQDFVSTLHSPIAKDELQRVLHSGRGVFRNFKNVLKSYPEVEKSWNVFKHRRMMSYITEWYNGLCEVWGLETLPNEFEETDDLVLNDFVFKAEKGAFSTELRQFVSQGAAEALQQENPAELGDVFFDLWHNVDSCFLQEKLLHIVCRPESDEIAGCICASSISKRTDRVAIARSFYVQEKFRGLGIGAKLVELCVQELKFMQKDWFLLPYSLVPEFMERALLRAGFSKCRLGFIIQTR